LFDSKTFKEGTKTPLTWITQPSRWQKGYIMTYIGAIIDLQSGCWLTWVFGAGLACTHYSFLRLPPSFLRRFFGYSGVWRQG
jgi:hypothetical protein